ncbi:hypothetical protein HDU91_004410, partial [Kappamyces sp. JEL0680]
SLTHEWDSGHANRAGLAPAVLYCPMTDRLGWFDSYLNMAFRDIALTLTQPVHLLDYAEAWYSFCSAQLLGRFQAYTRDTREDDKNHGMTQFIDEKIQLCLEKEKLPIPGTSAAAIFVVGSLITASYHLHFSPSVGIVSKVIARFQSRLGEPHVPAEVRSALLFALTDLSFISAVGDDALTGFVWSECTRVESIDSIVFSQGYCAAKIVYSVLHSAKPTSARAKKIARDFVARFFSTVRGWSSLGAAVGFSLLVSSVHFQLTDFLPQQQLLDIVQHAFTALDQYSQQTPLVLDTSAWVIAFGWQISYSMEQVQEVLLRAVELAK